MPGSIGATGPDRVFKGKKMPGQMGNKYITVTNLEIIEVIPEKNELLIKGAVPGARNGLLYIQGLGEFDIAEKKEVEVKEEKTEDKAPASIEKKEESKVEEVKTEDKVESVEKAPEENSKEEAKPEALAEEVKAVPEEVKKEEKPVQEPKNKEAKE
ncbi:hypothetical protein HQ571_05070 [Candidatus Kuenenbacteria bacterium]|nr:hypothetical protein [Candidatus Kuenenbacteria bacterium]